MSISNVGTMSLISAGSGAGERMCGWDWVGGDVAIVDGLGGEINCPSC